MLSTVVVESKTSVDKCGPLLDVGKVNLGARYMCVWVVKYLEKRLMVILLKCSVLSATQQKYTHACPGKVFSSLNSICLPDTSVHQLLEFD